ncbi:MAG: hypothetical protein RQ899_05915 [Pseudomonadales bacterium]|nr:hypothetical protein [Pseudomonadales bacterium]
MFEFLFKYSPEVFAESKFLLASEWPLWLMLALGLAFAVALLAMLGWKRKVLAWWQLSTLGLLQFLMFAVILLVLWQPALVTERLVSGENAVVLMLDTSASMALVDGDTTRMNQARPLLTEAALAPLAERYSILPYAFSGAASPLDSFATLPDPGAATHLGQSLLQALRQSANASLGAVILVSDGADNDGAISQAELSEIAGFGVPIHTVGIGREIIPEDLELAGLVLPDKSLPGTTLSAQISIRHDQGGSARLKVYDGETFLSMHDIPLKPDDKLTVAFVDVEIQEPGQLDLRFTLDPVAGENILANNSRTQVVDAPESRYRILYFEGEPRWEYKFMQRALMDDPSVQLATLLRVTPNKFYRQGIDSPEQLEVGFPTTRAELYSYDALIIGSVDVAELSSEQQALIRDFVSERGGSLLMLAGLRGLGQGGWGESVVGQTLPARLSREDSAFVRKKAPAVLADGGLGSAMLQFSDKPSENLRLWSELPEVADYQAIGPLRPAATTLLNVNVEGRMQPLLVTQPYGRGRTYILATGGTWRWQMSLPQEDLRHETFWRQLARGLVANSPRPFELSSRVSNDKIKIRASLRDLEDEANAGLAVSALVSSDKQALSLELLPVPEQAGVYEAEFTPQETGLYAIEAISRRGSEPLNSVRSATRYENNAESFYVRQNRALLERIASATNGRYWTPAQWAQIPEAISYSSAGITEQDLRQLWDAPVIFFVLIFLKALEWLLRRRWRTI